MKDKDIETIDVILRKIYEHTYNPEEGKTKIKEYLDSIAGYFGRTEYKICLDAVKDGWKAMNASIRGNETEIREDLQRFVEEMGYTDFYDIPNTKDNLNKLLDIIFINTRG